MKDSHRHRLACFTVILLTLFLSTAPPAATPAVADGTLEWTAVNIPAEGEDGNWVLSAGADISSLVVAGDGTLYAVVSGAAYSLFRSRDGGLSWEHPGDVQSAVTALAVSHTAAGNIYYATTDDVFVSTDGGDTFLELPDGPWAGTGTITAIAVTCWNNRDVLIVGTRDDDPGEFGGVYARNGNEAIPRWVDTGIGGYDTISLATTEYEGDYLIVTVATDEIRTCVLTRTATTGWNGLIGGARLDSLAVSAVIAVPEHDTTELLPEEFCAYIGISTAGGGGGLYRFEGAAPPRDSALNELTPNEDNPGTGISGLCTSGTSNASGVAFLMTGLKNDPAVYTSRDGGLSWVKSLKSPTGDELSGLAVRDGTIYAASTGSESALSVSRDGARTFSQTSLIDAVVASIVDFAPSPCYGEDSTIFLLTRGAGPGSEALWKSQTGGTAWERVLVADPGRLEGLRMLAVCPDYGTSCRNLYLAGQSSGKNAIWRSGDGGQTFRRYFPTDPVSGAEITIDAWQVAKEDILYVAGFDGSRSYIYVSERGRLDFTRRLGCASQPLYSIALSPRHGQDGMVLAGDNNGSVYWGTVTTNSLKPLGNGAVSASSSPVTVAFDPASGRNGTVYAITTLDNAVYRTRTGKDAVWENIHPGLPAGTTLSGLTISADGILYAAATGAGRGIERSLDPTAHAPVFEGFSRGLEDDATLSGLWQAGNRLWSVDTTNQKLMVLEDTLGSPPGPLSPQDNASGLGTVIDHMVRNVMLDWETRRGATSYEWECSYDDEFTAGTATLTGITTASAVRLPALIPATSYRWRIRVRTPLLSPWSETRLFTTVMDTETIPISTQSPVSGASGISVRPVFRWTAVSGAESYEICLATSTEALDASGNATVFARVKGNIWQCSVSLDYATAYYWKVRACCGGTYSAWSEIGMFVTENAPPPLKEDVPAASPETASEEIAFAGDVGGKIPHPAPAQATAPAVMQAPGTPPSSALGPFVTVTMPVWTVFVIFALILAVVLALLAVIMIILKFKR
ncbi:MAG: hypothetical protein N2506_01810 [Dehalococcoidales bacterium]|nr:hypothetical protein [Dehalococcoidales bacterium]